MRQDAQKDRQLELSEALNRADDKGALPLCKLLISEIWTQIIYKSIIK